MYGFSIYKGLSPYEDSIRCIKHKDYLCVNNMIDKFKDDKLFVETDNYIIILDGLIINKKQLQADKEWKNVIVELYETLGDTFFSQLRGCFAGGIYDKRRNRWLIFTDQLGQKFVYYTLIDNKFICSSMIGNIYHSLKENGIPYSLSDDSAIMLLSFGFMMKDMTLSEEIKKIQPGCYILYENNKIIEKNYYTLNNTPNYNRNLTDTINELDSLFSQAVIRQYEKDKEYGYSHICALSAGLDCRMTTFIAHELGYADQTNITFSQSDYWDDIIPKAMARDLRHQWIFKSLDDARWLMTADEITEVTGGNVFYQGSAHANSLYKAIDWARYGLIHSGQLGDVTISCHIKSNDEKYNVGDGACFNNYIEDLRHILGTSVEYPNKEIGLWYCRYLNGTNNGQQNEYNFSETFSPFLDLDFLEFSLSIPCEMRQEHRLYKKWILLKHPQAAAYGWEKNGGGKITTPTIHIMGKDVPIYSIPKKAIREIKKRTGLGTLDTKHNMQPIGYYIKTNPELRQYIDNYNDYLNRIDNERVKTIIKSIMQHGRGGEKAQALSLLSAIKVFF